MSMSSKLDLQFMLEDQADSQVRFEWMVQNSQVDDRLLAEALVQEAFPDLLQMALTLAGELDKARLLALLAIRAGVGKRHRFTGEVSLKVWLFSLLYDLVRHGAGHDPYRGPQTNLLVFLRYAQELSVKEIGLVAGLDEKQAASLLDAARRKMFEIWGQPIGRPDLPLGHGQYAPLMQAAQDGCLNPRQIAVLEAHLHRCDACNSYAGELARREERLKNAVSAAWPPQKLDEAERQEILQALGEKMSQTAKRRRLSLSVKEFSLGMGVVFLIALVAWAGGMLKPDIGRPAGARTRVYVYRKITATPQARRQATPTMIEPPTTIPRIQAGVATETLPPRSALIDFRKFSVDSLAYTGSQVLSSSGPVALGAVLRYWGWVGSPERAVDMLKPNPQDENVMPYELINFVTEYSRYKILYRLGGTVALLKQLTGQGFPVIVERGVSLPESRDWFGRYQVVLGFENSKASLAVQVNFPVEGPELVSEYVFDRDWRAFNYSFLVIYPADKENLVMKLLGDYGDEEFSDRAAAQRASEEIFSTEGVDRFFAWFNRGTSLAELDDYGGAAKAFDEAFALYNKLPEEGRPWRILWYQTRPYAAYYYTARYRDLINLATSTLKISEGSVLEESYYWRALAREALGDQTGAIADLQEALKLNPHFDVGREQLQRLTSGT